MLHWVIFEFKGQNWGVLFSWGGGSYFFPYALVIKPRSTGAVLEVKVTQMTYSGDGQMSGCFATSLASVTGGETRERER